MSENRFTALPTGTAKGFLLVADGVRIPTLAALQASSGDHRNHEGLVLWLGRTVGSATLVLACAAPPKLSGPGRVHVGELAVGATARAARAFGLGVVAQVHSHPGRHTRHSEGDDQLVLMPFEGMFSLVVADYGRGSLLPQEGAGLHQHQAGRWVKIGGEAMHVIPSLIPVPARDHP